MTKAEASLRSLSDLTEAEQKLIELIRQMGYGEIFLQMEDGQSEEIRELGNPRYYYRYAGILRTANVRFCIFLGKNLCIRSR